VTALAAIAAGVLASVLTGTAFVLFVLPRQLAAQAREAAQRAEAEARAARQRAEAVNAVVAAKQAEIRNELDQEASRDTVDVANDLISGLRSGRATGNRGGE
jgi:hypothetical protein